jgi:hypothetical protein
MAPQNHSLGVPPFLSGSSFSDSSQAIPDRNLELYARDPQADVASGLVALSGHDVFHKLAELENWDPGDRSGLGARKPAESSDELDWHGQHPERTQGDLRR